MTKGLMGKKIAIAGSRKTEEITALIERQGGEALLRPLQGTTFSREKELAPAITKMIEDKPDWIILTTGMGTEKLIQTAEAAHLKTEFLDLLRSSKIAARGYKTINTLKKLHISIDAEDDDGTTAGLVNALNAVDFSNALVYIQLHGIPSPVLKGFFSEQGASVEEILPYKHTPPEPEVPAKLMEEIFGGFVDGVCFTTQLQVHSLFSFAKAENKNVELKDLFQSNVLAASVGKVTTEALYENGVTRVVAPEHERMGAMIMELSRYAAEMKE
ncbi:uroporphyrinogen-III synthase [Alteribacillus sp. HJP-4]|uniref:uroporphyrinogen-III synthase n=1 Tax=Alteribacillus sp. HJP-4 TaxID=2775394 RepID=UPI0035CD12FA